MAVARCVQGTPLGASDRTEKSAALPEIVKMLQDFVTRGRWRVRLSD